MSNSRRPSGLDSRRNSNALAGQSALQFSNFGDGCHVLVTGGQGFVGSHTVVRLLEEGFMVSVVDNSSTSCHEAMSRAKLLVSPAQAAMLFFHECDLLDTAALKQAVKVVAERKRIDACVHCAGIKHIGDAIRYPLKCHQNNITATLNLLGLLDQYGCRQFVYSSSASVYGTFDEVVDATEEASVGHADDPYSASKLMSEKILQDQANSLEGRAWGITVLRFFNPVGAHPSGRIGEDPVGGITNVMPYVAQVMMGKRESLKVNGDDFTTKDGTNVKDYCHVMDIAEGHLCALARLQKNKTGYNVYNLGAGKGTSTLEVIQAMEKASGLKLAYKMGKKKAGEPATQYCNVKKAEAELEWTPKFDLDRICKDLWRWQNMNPNGYDAPAKAFGAFKQQSFSTSTMPKLSSESRPKPSMPKPDPRGVAPTMRGRGTSMDDLMLAAEEGGGGQSF